MLTDPFDYQPLHQEMIIDVIYDIATIIAEEPEKEEYFEINIKHMHRYGLCPWSWDKCKQEIRRINEENENRYK